MERSQRGFTLPEVLVSAAILAYCLSALLATFINSAALNDSTRNLMRATTHAEFVMENIKATAFAAIPSNHNGAQWDTWTLNTAAVNAAGMAALNTEAITTTLTGTNPIDVTVTVTWHDLRGRSRSTVLRTLISG
ncbi:MAG: type II secretion system protein [Candidatus Omnitrophota bacterium]